MATALKLYEAVDAYETVLDWIDEHEAEIRAAGGELPAELAALLDEVEGDLSTKVERTALVILNQRRNAEAAEAEAKRLSAIAATYERQAEALSSYLRQQMQRAGTAKVETPRAKAWLQKNGRPSIRLADPNAIPERFRRVRVEFDSQKAYEEIKVAGLIPEPEDGAVELDGLIIERGQHLRVR